MRKLIGFLIIGLVAITGLPAAAGAITVIPITNFDGEFGSFSTRIFSDGEYQFTFDVPSSGSASVGSTTARVQAQTALDVTSISLDGVYALTQTSFGNTRSWELNDQSIDTGNHYLDVVFGNASGQGFAGTVAFEPTSAVPEPGVWVMLMLGLCVTGFALRRRSRENLRTAYAIA